MSEEVKEFCNFIPQTDKKELCKTIVEQHANMEISTKEAEKKLSELTGQDVIMMEEPDWKLLPQDKDTLETWATALCMTYTEDDKKIDACIDSMDKLVKGEKPLMDVAERIGNLVNEKADEVAKMIMITAPKPQDVKS